MTDHTAPELQLQEVVLTEVTLADEERQPCEVWTRVMGYHRPVNSFNKGKQGEYAERVCFTEASAELV